jgi:hypothetical protein
MGSVQSHPLYRQKISKNSTVPAHIFAENTPPPIVEFKLPEPDERLHSTPQLVCCLGLLKIGLSPESTLKPIAVKWIQTIEKDADEQIRLRAIAKDVIRVF